MYIQMPKYHTLLFVYSQSRLVIQVMHIEWKRQCSKGEHTWRCRPEYKKARNHTAVHRRQFSPCVRQQYLPVTVLKHDRTHEKRVGRKIDVPALYHHELCLGNVDRLVPD